MLPARLVLSKRFSGSPVTSLCSLPWLPEPGLYQSPGQFRGQVGLAAVKLLLGSCER